MSTNKTPVDPEIYSMVCGWIDNYIANTRKLVPLLEVGFGEWVKRNNPKVQNLESFIAIKQEFFALIKKNLEFKLGGKMRTNDLLKFTTIWNIWEQVITQQAILIENDANTRKEIKLIALTRCLKLVTQTVHDELKDEKKLSKVLIDMITKLYNDVKKLLKNQK